MLKSFQDRIDSLEGQERYYFGFHFSSEQAGDLSSLLNNVPLHYEVISSRHNCRKRNIVALIFHSFSVAVSPIIRNGICLIHSLGWRLLCDKFDLNRTKYKLVSLNNFLSQAVKIKKS